MISIYTPKFLQIAQYLGSDIRSVIEFGELQVRDLTGLSRIW